MSEPDLSKIVSLIMENQGLIEEIRGLAKKDTESNAVVEGVATEENQPQVTIDDSDSTEASTVQRANVTFENGLKKSKRRELLCALKPYVSEERSRAIDTMISIAEILDMMKAR